jgi:hypothetical protein
MELTKLALPAENWAATPCAAQALILAQRERIRDLEARLGSFGSDSEAGSRFAERLLTVTATCRQRGRLLLAFLMAAGEAAIQGTPAPSLLSAPEGG